MRILIAEDNLTSRVALAGILKKSGHEVVETLSGAAAWEALQQPDAPALAILDWMMPEMDGLEVVSRVRAVPTDCPTYFILLSVKSEKADIIAGLEAGANDYLAKPFDPSELLARVEVGRRLVELQAALAGMNKDLRQAQTKLDASQERYGAMLHSITDAIISTDSEGKIVGWNPGAERLYGYRESEILGQPLSLFQPARHQGLHFAGMAWGCVGGERDGVEQTIEMESLRKDGSEFPMRLSLSEWQVNGEKFYTAIVHDITERKRAEAERERLSRAIEQVAEVVVITNAKGQIQYVNPAFEALTGYTSEEAIGQTPSLLKSGHHDKTFYCAMWETLRSGKTWQGTLVNRKKDGTYFTEETTISPVYDADDEIINYVAVKRDITYELRLKAQFDQAQKMESVGRLAGSVAHDFNNMLGVILGHTELAMEQMEPAHLLFDHLQEIRKAADRSADLTRQLLAFARQQTIVPKVLDLSESIAGMLNMLGRLLGENIQLAFLPGKDLWPVRMDPSQLDQVLVNLCVNARDAITDMGMITIETGNSTFDEAYCAHHAGFVPGEYVGLTVSDTGCGIEKETLAHIFEPFFTTKEIGKGTGLGLATVYGIVEQNRGFIHVDSEPGRGTRITIHLDRHLGNAASAQTDSAAAPHLRGQETILLVEDELAILSMTQLLLERQGYTVLAANTPGTAIRLAQEHSTAIDLLMTDVIMPEMNGRDLASKLQSLYPHLQLLFMSGYTANVIAQHGVLDEGVYFIQKPFSMRDLATTVRKTLDHESQEQSLVG
jgi:PAS domain S-box-containing protein